MNAREIGLSGQGEIPLDLVRGELSKSEGPFSKRALRMMDRADGLTIKFMKGPGLQIMGMLEEADRTVEGVHRSIIWDRGYVITQQAVGNKPAAFNWQSFTEKDSSKMMGEFGQTEAKFKAMSTHLFATIFGEHTFHREQFWYHGQDFKWARFTHRYPFAVFETTCNVGGGFHLKNYDPIPNFQRAQDLTSRVDEANWDFLPAYLILTKGKSVEDAWDLDQTIRRKLREAPEEMKKLIPLGEVIAGEVEDGTWNRGLYQFWLERFLAGDIDDGVLATLPVDLKGVFERINTVDQLSLPFGSARTYLKYDLRRMMAEPDLIPVARFIPTLIDNEIFPTHTVLQHLISRGVEGLEELRQLKYDIQRGNLNPQNTLQRDLEYWNYLKMAKDGKLDYDDFQKLDFVEPPSEGVLRVSDKMEAAATAYEDAHLYWFIRGGLNPNRDKVVIGNERFGYRFYVDPLKPDLEDLGVSVNSYGTAYIHSMIPNDEHDFEALLPQSFADYLTERGYPNIVIVDGSNDAFRNGIPRLPSAHVGYLGWFMAYNEALGVTDYFSPSIEQVLKTNESYGRLVDRLRATDIRTPYNISFWTPQQSSRILIGSHEVDYRTPNNEGPQLVLANPIVIPSEHPDFPEELSQHQSGYFNDPDEKLPQGSELVLTKHGMQVIHHGMDEAQFTSLVQMAIITNLPRMIRETNPLQRLV